MDDKPICLYPGCIKPSVTRGLCTSHYVSAASYVGAKKVTWLELEANGKVLPPKTKKGKPSWFLQPPTP